VLLLKQLIRGLAWLFVGRSYAFGGIVCERLGDRWRKMPVLHEYGLRALVRASSLLHIAAHPRLVCCAHIKRVTYNLCEEHGVRDWC
jgi:hypothetical protein